MRSIAIMNQKGGVGKTTTAVNVSAALANTGAKVCLIDLDPQAHATLHFNIEPQAKIDSIYDVLVDDLSLAEVRKQTDENLWLIPAHLDLAAAEVELASKIGREMLLRDKLAADDMEFDYIFMDCPPSLGVLTLNALAAVDEVFVPLQPHYLALHGLVKLTETLELVSKRLNGRLELSGIILCMFDGQVRLSFDVAEGVDEFLQQKYDFLLKKYGTPTPCSNAKILQTKIRRNIRLAEAPSHGKTIFAYDPRSNGAEDYRNLADEIRELQKTTG